MLSRLHHSIVLDCTLDQAQDVCINPNNLQRLQQLMCPDYEILRRGEDDKTPQVSTTREQFSQMLEVPTLPDLPWPPLDPSTDCPHATHFKFSEPGAQVSGSQYALINDNVVLFHSAVKRFGIEEWKLRVLEEMGSQGSKQTRVTETVWGSAPIWLMGPLKMLGIPQRQHSAHMNMYHKLLAADEERPL